MTPVQDDRFRALANDYEAVATTPLADGHIILVARDGGKIAKLEVITRDGTVLAHDDVIRVIGRARREALALTDTVTDHLVAHLALTPDDQVNLSAIARDTGIARQTLYNRRAAASEPVAAAA